MLRTATLLGLLFLVACRAVEPREPTHAITSPEFQPTTPVTIPALAPSSPPPTETATPLALSVTPTEPLPTPPAPTILSSLTPVPTAGFPDPTRVVWQPVISGLQKPLDLTHAGDGSGRLFIVEQAGLIRIFAEGTLLPQPFLEITDRVGSNGFEQGLLGLAFHPNYAATGYFYVNYTDRQGDTVIARFQRAQSDPNRAEAGSEMVLIRTAQPYANHNGGAMAFGPDGFLYIGLGDGGSAGDPQNLAQSLDTFLGKLLRIDVDSAEPYAVPPGNPYIAGGGKPEIWAYGLRNPWRITFDRLTGDLYIGDVGQNQWEEIHFLPASEIKAPGRIQAFNFGWVYFEGNHPYRGSPPPGLELIPPVAEYDHQLGCSVTGGVVYRGGELPAWEGLYLFGDYCSGRVWGLIQASPGQWEQELLFEDSGRIASFGQDEQGEVYLIDHTGAIFRLAAI